MAILGPVVRWWLVLSIIGWAAVPIARRLFVVLPDRGLSLARPLGLLIAGYVFWLGVSARVLPNSAPGAGFAVLCVLVLAVIVAARDWPALKADLRERRWLLLGYEWLFFVALAGWSLYRAHNPAIETAGGEKYMEMAFISSVLRSPGFPPADPWLSGHGVSYYYFGYVLIGLVTRLAGVLPYIAFNLVIPAVLGMCLLGAFGIGYNLLRLTGIADRRWSIMAGATSAALLAFVGSLEGALEVAYIRGWGSPAFWRFLDIRNLTVGANSCGDEAVGYGAGGWLPHRFLWWWRGSRVIHDRCAEVIHEFPFFSFMLADNHPHVLALPFAILVCGLALAILAGRWDREPSPAHSVTWFSVPLALGALGFLNAWDLPTYGLIVLLAYGLRSLCQSPQPVKLELTDSLLGSAAGFGMALLGWRVSGRWLVALAGAPGASPSPVLRMLLALAFVALAAAAVYGLWQQAARGSVAARRLWAVGRFAVWLVVLSLALYAPFHIGFRSQAAGIGVVVVRSRLVQWLVHFGFLWFLMGTLVVVTAGSVWRLRGRWSQASWLLIALGGGLVVFAAWQGAWVALLLSATLGAAGVALMELWAGAQRTARSVTTQLDTRAGSPSGANALPEASEAGIGSWPVAAAFALICGAVGLLVCLGTEFFFIRDLFGSRMNTVFKLFFQAWVLFSLAGGFAVSQALLSRSRLRWLWVPITTVLLAASLVYPMGALHTRTNGWRMRDLTLNGLAWWESSHPDDLAVARWLNANVPGQVNILEASGGGYEHNGRISMATGLPTVLGWEGHEHQWRGTREQIDPRRSDVEEAFTTRSVDRLRSLLDRYDVRFVIVGDSERSKYNLTDADVARLERWLRPVFRSGRTTVLAYP